MLDALTATLGISSPDLLEYVRVLNVRAAARYDRTTDRLAHKTSK